jgi:hypothetical protein
MFTKKIRYALGVLALVAAASANAAVITKDYYWGPITAPDDKLVFHAFGDEIEFKDIYHFTLTNAANSFGGVFELDFSRHLDIDLDYVSLVGPGGYSQTDYSPGTFSFLGLGAGDYSFIIRGDVDGNDNNHEVVSYLGSIEFKKNYTAVSEPSTFALAGLGLLGLALVMRRRLFN